jgi:hypothetical protein
VSGHHTGIEKWYRQHRIPSRRSCFVRFRVWNTSSHVILAADY